MKSVALTDAERAARMIAELTFRTGKAVDAETAARLKSIDRKQNLYRTGEEFNTPPGENFDNISSF
jgi:hypothetical protein